jgi:hypothetical protein
VYDPTRVSYARLLEIFWESHDAGSRPWSRQYKAAVFYLDEGQMVEAARSRDREEARIRRQVHTEIVPAGPFYSAEAYHQKYALRGNAELEPEVTAMYPGEEEFADSTAAARINGYVAGYGDLLQLRSELPGLGLSEAGGKRLREIVHRYEAHRGNREAKEKACPAR